MVASISSLGTSLRNLIELLDDDVQRHYTDASLRYRPRYTPVVRALEATGPASIRAIADQAGMTHSAVSQTVAQMVTDGLVRQAGGRDGRERIVAMMPALEVMLPRLQVIWDAAERAAADLDGELSYPLSDIVGEAIRALRARSFSQRLDVAAPVAC